MLKLEDLPIEIILEDELPGKTILSATLVHSDLSDHEDLTVTFTDGTQLTLETIEGFSDLILREPSQESI